MGRFEVLFSTLLVAGWANAGLIGAPLTYATLTPGAPVGPDGRVLDTAEVAVAKAEHATAHLNERINLANEAARSNGVGLISVQPAGVANLVAGGAVYTSVVPGASVGADGKVVDTPEVAVAKAAHAAAHVNERINLANEAVRSGGVLGVAGVAVPTLAGRVLTGVVPGATVGLDGRVLDTPEVAAAKAAHAAAHINEKINLVNVAARSGAVFAPEVVGENGVVLSFANGAPIGVDGRVVETPEVAVARAAHVAAHINEKVNLANEAAKSADVLVASPLSYGRLVY